MNWVTLYFDAIRVKVSRFSVYLMSVGRQNKSINIGVILVMEEAILIDRVIFLHFAHRNMWK